MLFHPLIELRSNNQTGIMQTLDTFIAVNRFGLGPKPGEAEQIVNDPKGCVKNQIRRNQKTPKALSNFRPSADIIKEVETSRRNKKTSSKSMRQMVKKNARKNYYSEFFQRTVHMVKTDTPFAERMVLFWSNHFTVSAAGKKDLAPVVAAYEREAIRPHIFGKFEDMLLAVIQHPVMLAYLDNHTSMGPNSVAGMRRKFRTGVKTGLNENLSREILELHSLGVNGGYGQNDVIGLAKAISGWSHGAVRGKRDKTPIHGEFEFKSYFHEPDSKYILGKRYKAQGVKTGRKVLKDLARHPSTAKFIATKLARHFIADDPPASAINRLAEVYLKSEGDLADVSRALVELDEVWAVPASKVKNHYELMISAWRASGRKSFDLKDFAEPIQAFAQVPFMAPSPAGWPDRAAEWISPESLMRRIEWLRQLSAKMPPDWNPERFLDDVIGPIASDETRLWVSRAPSTDAGLALVMSSPEFQRR